MEISTPGPYIIEANVKTGATDSALLEILKEVKKYADNGITQDELVFTQNSMTQNELLNYETPAQKANFLKIILDHNLSKDFTAKQNTVLRDLSLDEVNFFAKRSLPYNNLVILIVGDKAKVYDRLLNLGYTVSEINTDGTIRY